MHSSLEDRIKPLWNQSRFTGLVDLREGPIGRVVSSEREPSGAHQFCFWADDNALSVDVGHIVVAFSEESAVIGVVDEPRRYSDLRSFLDDYFDRRMEIALSDDGPTRRPEILVFNVNVLATRHLRDDVDSKRPAVNGPVFFATPEVIKYALDTENFDGAMIPALMHTNGNYLRDEHGEIERDEHDNPRFQKTPIYLDENYLLGPEAGHANWTGQSGLATKTSHVLFLMSSIFQTLEKEGDKTVAALMFNVKGPDLLWLDKPANPEPGMEDAYRGAGARPLGRDQEDAYRALGLDPRPFEKVNIFAPFQPGRVPGSVNKRVDLRDYKPGDLNTTRTGTGHTDRVFPILWSLDTALYYPHKLFSFGDLDDKFYGFIFELRERKIGSFDQLNDLFRDINDYFDSGDAGDTWNGHHKATIRKAQNRFKSLEDKFGGLLAGGSVDYGTTPKVEDAFTPNEMRVVDISQCNTKVQELIVTSCINAVWNRAEKSNMGVDKLVVFVDELNKYASSGMEGGLRDTLVDIAARGRHLNVVLLGAQQFRSKVDGEILGNCGTSFYGRVGDEEIINTAYRSISDTSKQELLGLKKGRLLVRHAHFREPLFGTFPFPPCIAGINGERVFQGTSSVTVGPEVSLFRLLQTLMGDRAPVLADIKTESDGLDPDTIEEVRQGIRKAYQDLHSDRGNAWRAMKRQLQTRQEMKRHS